MCPNSPSDTMYPNSPSDINTSVFNWDNPSLPKQKNCVSSTTNTGQVYKYKLYKHDWQHNQQTSKSYFNTTVKSSLMKMITWLSNLWVISNWPWALKQFLALTWCATHKQTHTHTHTHTHTQTGGRTCAHNVTLHSTSLVQCLYLMLYSLTVWQKTYLTFRN